MNIQNILHQQGIQASWSVRRVPDGGIWALPGHACTGMDCTHSLYFPRPVTSQCYDRLACFRSMYMLQLAFWLMYRLHSLTLFPQTCYITVHSKSVRKAVTRKRLSTSSNLHSFIDWVAFIDLLDFCPQLRRNTVYSFFQYKLQSEDNKVSMLVCTYLHLCVHICMCIYCFIHVVWGLWITIYMLILPVQAAEWGQQGEHACVYIFACICTYSHVHVLFCSLWSEACRIVMHIPLSV